MPKPGRIYKALHGETEETYIPHEVKAPWAEAHKGQHIVDLLGDMQTRDRVARPVAQILSYMVTCRRDGTNASSVQPSCTTDAQC